MKLAAFGCAPPRTPSAIRASMRSSTGGMENSHAVPSARPRIEELVEAVADLRDPEDLARSASLREIADAGLDPSSASR
jgi:hypothetical protein